MKQSVCPHPSGSLVWTQPGPVLEIGLEVEGTEAPFSFGCGTVSDPKCPSYHGYALLIFLAMWKWLVSGGIGGRMTIGKGERLVERRPFHATRLPGRLSSGMPEKGCISFIAGQTKQPSIKSPLEDNILELMPCGMAFLFPALKPVNLKPFIQTVTATIWHILKVGIVLAYVSISCCVAKANRIICAAWMQDDSKYERL